MLSHSTLPRSRRDLTSATAGPLLHRRRCWSAARRPPGTASPVRAAVLVLLDQIQVLGQRCRDRRRFRPPGTIDRSAPAARFAPRHDHDRVERRAFRAASSAVAPVELHVWSSHRRSWPRPGRPAPPPFRSSPLPRTLSRESRSDHRSRCRSRGRGHPGSKCHESVMTRHDQRALKSSCRARSAAAGVCNRARQQVRPGTNFELDLASASSNSRIESMPTLAGARQPRLMLDSPEQLLVHRHSQLRRTGIPAICCPWSTRFIAPCSWRRWCRPIYDTR